MKKYLCDTKKLYDWLPENSKVLSDGSEVVFVDGPCFGDGEDECTYCDILSSDGYPVVFEGEVHQFVQNNNKSWTNIPSEGNSFTITLTQEEFEILCQPV